jgi:ribosome-associated toxin RatA of RatAB toxin-antitoxin module
MHSIRKSVLVPYSAERMFELVDRVEDYPRFLPWCGGISVHERSETVLDVTIHIEFLKIKSHFRTRDTRKTLALDMQLVDGPFRSLTGSWRFIPLMDDACKIEFDLDYDFSNRAIEAVVGPVFGRITQTFVDAFITEADRRYA